MQRILLKWQCSPSPNDPRRIYPQAPLCLESSAVGAECGYLPASSPPQETCRPGAKDPSKRRQVRLSSPIHRSGRITGNNRPKSPHPTMESLIKGLYFLSVGFSSGGGVPLPSMILAGRRRRRSPCEVRSTSSQFPSRRTRLQPTGPNTATRSSYADARFVNEILLWVTAVAASRLTTSITIGFGFIVGAASGAG